jgi:hypothetical protein
MMLLVSVLHEQTCVSIVWRQEVQLAGKIARHSSTSDVVANVLARGLREVGFKRCNWRAKLPVPLVNSSTSDVVENCVGAR